MLDPLYTAVSWVLLRWYQLFTTLGMSKSGGLTWALSIVMLVVEVGEAVAVAAAGDNELVISNRALGFGESARSKVNIEP